MSDPWFKFYPSDWLSGTRGLTPAETGVYVTLVCMMYENDGQLTRDDRRLARRSGCTSAAFKKIIANLLAEKKLVECDGVLSNDRVQKELAERSNRVQKASDAAHHKWSKSRGIVSKIKGKILHPHIRSNPKTLPIPRIRIRFRIRKIQIKVLLVP